MNPELSATIFGGKRKNVNFLKTKFKKIFRRG